jgi:hypothetical protein
MFCSNHLQYDLPTGGTALTHSPGFQSDISHSSSPIHPPSNMAIPSLIAGSYTLANDAQEEPEYYYSFLYSQCHSNLYWLILGR